MVHGRHPKGRRCLNHPIGSFLWKNSLELPWGLLLSADATLMTKGHSTNAQLEKVQWYADFSLSKDFFKKRFSCLFQLDDAFNTSRSDVLVYSGLRTLRMATEARRTFSLTVRYKFNAAKNKYKGTGAGEAQK
ncbi:MAG: outer membrane beta-barrel family protein, partial [Phocaeicola sp.]|nr:outer membrane beta-barrel family protein [Phocaeicola sp.]